MSRRSKRGGNAGEERKRWGRGDRGREELGRMGEESGQCCGGIMVKRKRRRGGCRRVKSYGGGIQGKSGWMRQEWWGCRRDRVVWRQKGDFSLEDGGQRVWRWQDDYGGYFRRTVE